MKPVLNVPSLCQFVWASLGVLSVARVILNAIMRGIWKTVKIQIMAYFAQCLEQADLAEWVSSLKEKENTKLVQELEEGAVNLSGGQSQKLLLARALYKNAPILLLDEPTAALDPIAESNIYEKYNQLSAHKTSIFISHRLASTRFCDRIFLMEDGRIAEEGTHEELLKKAGSYAKMFEVQRQYYV